MPEGITHVNSVLRRPSGLSGLACAPNAKQVDCQGKGKYHLGFRLPTQATQAANVPNYALH